jgi:adenylate cyclase
MTEASQNVLTPLETQQTLDISRVVGNLLQRALQNVDLQTCLERACVELVACGVPVARAHIALNTLHPLFKAVSYTWYREQSTSERYYPHAPDAGSWVLSPFYFMIQHGVTELRRHLTGNEQMLDFPLLEELAAEGFSDYRAYALPFKELEGIQEEPEGLAGSWATATPGGFTQARINALREVELALAVASKIHMESARTVNILNTYLGADAGRQVRRGRIQRGDVESVNAVIWYSDMRGSTERASRVSGKEFLDDINDYFSCTAGAVMEQGGEVLRFIGDAVLAIFPARDDAEEAQAFTQVVSALKSAHEKLNETNGNRQKAGKDELSYGVAVHFGEVLFGNIGAPSRLEFSVVGEAANEVARLESMTKTLGISTLLSESVASRTSLPTVDLGQHEIVGSDTVLHVYGVPNLKDC